MSRDEKIWAYIEANDLRPKIDRDHPLYLVELLRAYETARRTMWQSGLIEPPSVLLVSA